MLSFFRLSCSLFFFFVSRPRLSTPSCFPCPGSVPIQGVGNSILTDETGDTGDGATIDEAREGMRVGGPVWIGVVKYSSAMPIRLAAALSRIN